MPLDVDSWWVVALGVTMILAGIVWRTTTRRRVRRDLQDRLDDRDPQVRAGAAEEAVTLGLKLSAALLLPFLEMEPDSSVRARCALAISQRQWEPALDSQVIELRRGAMEELRIQGFPVVAFGPAVARASDMGGPRREEVEAARRQRGEAR